jgi:hypothetical protein
VQRDAGMRDIDPREYASEHLKFGLVEVVYEWARGVPFGEICTLTTVQEGGIVRTITRLDEVCREVRNAARIIGDASLYRKMECASEMIKVSARRPRAETPPPPPDAPPPCALARSLACLLLMPLPVPPTHHLAPATQLHATMQRDVIFASSLYLS